MVVDYKGLKVPEVTELRRQIRNAKGSYKVVKNTLARRALAGTPFEALTEHFALTPMAEAARATFPAVDLDDEARGTAQVLGQLVGNDRPELDDGVVSLALHPAGADDDPSLVEGEIGGVEEEDLTDLGLERVEVQRGDRRAL